MSDKRHALGSLVTNEKFSFNTENQEWIPIKFLCVILGTWRIDDMGEYDVRMGDDPQNCDGEMKGYTLLSPSGAIEYARWRSTVSPTKDSASTL